ncbi:MAG: quinone-dependent dihydroorotate dehydrogenase [Campylobacter gracilis]|nr:quinone-dependent dihydroorotate dehydrogenase [Campylobacter gracilis]
MNYDTLKKIFFRFDPETAHKIAEFGLRALYATPGGLEALAKFGVYKDEILTQNIWNLSFDNPVGIAGGFDKNATMIAPLAALGFGHIDFGTFTPRPQSGNEKPRLFRLVSEQSIQNAMGFNNEGADVIERRVRKIYPFKIPIAANIGKNKATSNEDALSDYEALGSKFNGLCDFFIINVSSPNTPNLRALQENSFISELIGAMKKITNRPLVLKLAPDMSADQAIALCECAVQSGASGIIINNTSVDYSLSPNARDFGGLSGRLITEKSRKLFAQVARELFGRTILISCGGIDSAQEAYERIKSGASLVQIFTAFIFKGPFVAKSINEGLAELLRADGFNSISKAVGVNLKDRAGEGYGTRSDQAKNLGNGANFGACEDKDTNAKTDKISNAAKGEETSEISNEPKSKDADGILNDGESKILSTQADEILTAKTDEIPTAQTNLNSEVDENSDASANLNALINTDTATDQSLVEQGSMQSENSEIKSAKRIGAESKNLEAKSTKQGSADQKQDKISKTTSKSGITSKRGKISKDATQKGTAQKDTAKDDDALRKNVVQDNNASQQKGAEAKNLSKSDAKSENLEIKNAKQSGAASKTAKTKTAQKNITATKAAPKNDTESKNSKTKAAPKSSAESKSLKAKNAKQSGAKTKNAEAKETKEASGSQDAEQNSSKKMKG